MMRFILLTSVAVALAGCGEKPQTNAVAKNVVPAYMGAHDPFVAPGWKPGDKHSWEMALQNRALNTQNEYSRITK